MKYSAILTLFFFLVSFGAAIPIPGPSGTEGSEDVDRKGKARAVSPPPPPSRPNTPTPKDDSKAPLDAAIPIPGSSDASSSKVTLPPVRPKTPTPEDDSKVPLPGRTGVHTNGKVVTLYYGDDHLPQHMSHLQRNQELHPGNRQPMALSKDKSTNRKAALKDLEPAPPHPVTGLDRARDEKMPNMLANEHHSTTTTVAYVDKEESNKEGGHTGQFKKEINKAGEGAKGQLRPNPGWLPLHPDQRRGHEAPARLSSQTLLDGYKVGKIDSFVDHPDQKANPGRIKLAVVHKAKSKADNKAMDPLKQNHDHLVNWILQKPPYPPSSPSPGHKADPGVISAGRVLPAGHIWKPSTDDHKPSHAGAPGHLPDAEQRHPPRPQNHAHYMKQLSEKKAADDKQKEASAASSSQKPHAPATDSTDNAKTAANRAKFEKDFGPAKKVDKNMRAHESPSFGHVHPVFTHKDMTKYAIAPSPPRPANHGSGNAAAHAAPPPHPAPQGSSSKPKQQGKPKGGKK